MRIAGFIAEGLRDERIIHETFPSKELDDYWSTRPRYEEKDGNSASGSGSGQAKSQSWEEWQQASGEKSGADEPPPPPYTLEAEEVEAPAVQTPTRPSEEVQSRLAPSSSMGTPPPVAPRPDVGTGAVAAVGVAGAAGALNADASLPTNRPLVPLSSRPSLSRPPMDHAGSSTPTTAGPPPIPASSRPPVPSSSRPSTASVSDVSSLADDFRRQSISSPLLDRPPQHSAHYSDRPTSPLTSRPQAPSLSQSTCPNPPFPGYTPISLDARTSSSASTPPHPTPSPPFAAPSGPSFPTSPPPPSPGSWSQAAWPPPEWGAPPASPTTTTSYSVPYTPYQSAHRPTSGYTPGYAPPQTTYRPPSASPPPPLAPRPSLSARPSHTPSPPLSSSTSSYPGGGGDGGGFQFPQAPAEYGYAGDAYGQSQYPQPYGGMPSFPSGPSYAPYGPSSPTSPPNQGSAYRTFTSLLWRAHADVFVQRTQVAKA
jgi:hypothetical protein